MPLSSLLQNYHHHRRHKQKHQHLQNDLRKPRQKKRNSTEGKTGATFPREYTVVIKDKAVGLALSANTGGTDTAPIVDDIQGPALEAGTISKGDCLIAINDIDTRQGQEGYLPRQAHAKGVRVTLGPGV